MKFCVLLILCLLTGCANAHPPVDPRDFALRLEFRMGDLRTVCGATAVAKDTIDTAVHCMGLPLHSINGTPAQVVSSRRVSADRVRVVVSGVKFKSWARFGKAKQGDRVRWWGQPLGVPFVLREGLVVLVEAGGGLAIDATICQGDSGSGLFNDAGELVGVVSAMTNMHGCTFLLAQ